LTFDLGCFIIDSGARYEIISTAEEKDGQPI
jgi:hypothetical protein